MYIASSRRGGGQKIKYSRTMGTAGWYTIRTLTRNIPIVPCGNPEYLYINISTPSTWASSTNRVNFDHHHPHKNQFNRSSHSKKANFGPHTVNFDPTRKKQVTFDPNTKTKSNSIPHTKIKFRRHHWNHVNSIPALKSSQFWCVHTKTKLVSIHTLKPSIFRPHAKNQVNSDPCTEVKSILIPTIKSSQFWCRDTKTKLIPIPTLKPSLFRSPH